MTGGLYGGMFGGMDELQAYGAKWRTGDMVDVELRLYASADEVRARVPGCLDRVEHLRRALQLLLPEGSGLEWHYWMDELLEAWVERDILSVWGPSSAGKSSMLGLLAYVDLLAAPTDTLTVFITDKLSGHDQRAWSQVLHWRSLMQPKWQLGRVHASQNQKRLVTTSGGRIAGIYCTSTEAGDSVADMKRKLGGHNKRNRLVVDEAQTCGESVLQLKMNLGASGEYKEVLFGNPDAWTNPLGVHSDPADGDREKTTRREVKRWETNVTWHGRRGLCLVFDGRDSPGAVSAREARRLHFLPNQETLANYAEQEGGADSPSFWTYAVGRIPPGGLKPVVLTEADWRESGCWNRRPWAAGARRERFAGIDLSLGGDAIPVFLVEVGPAQEGVVAGHDNSAAANGRGKMVAQVMAEKRVHVNVKEHDYSGQIARQIVEAVTAWGVDWGNVCFDSSGAGAPVVDRVEVVASCPGRCVRVNSSHAVSDRRIGPKRQPAKDRFRNRAVELLWQAAEAVRRGLLWGLPQVVGEQMTTRGAFEKDGRLEVQPKAEWKRQRRGKSPDELDAVAVCVDELLRRGLLSLEVARPGPAPQWQGLDWMNPASRGGGTLGRRRRVTRMLRG